MRDCREIVGNEACYNEILSDAGFFGASLLGSEFKDAVIQLSDGSLMACLRADPEDARLIYETSVKRRDIVSSFLASMPRGYEVCHEWRKTKREFEYVSCEERMSGSAREIERRRRESFDKFNSYSNEIFFIVIKRNRIPSSLMTRDDLEEFCFTAQSLRMALSNADCFCRALKGGELLGFLKGALDVDGSQVADLKPKSSLSDCLLADGYCLKSIPLEIAGAEKAFASCLTVTALPSWTHPDLFGFCAHLDTQFRLVIKYKGYDRDESVKTLERKKKAYKNSLFSIMKYVKSDVTKEDVSDEFSHSALTGKRQCDSALELVAQRGWTSGICQISFCLTSKSEEDLENRIALIKKAFQKQGMLIRSEKIGNTLCFLSMIPGSKRMRDPIFVMSENFADMLHLVALSPGSARSRTLEERTGESIPFIYARNTDGSIHYFSLWGDEGKKGHTFITGPTGSGKSVLLSLMAAQWLKYKNTRVVMIDRDLSSYRLVKENGGSFHFPLADKSRFQPLENARDNLAGCLEFLKAVCFSQGMDFTAREKEECAAALSLMESGKETISMLYHIIRGRNKDSLMLPALSAYASGGEYSSLFEGASDDLMRLGRLTMIETSRILRNGISEQDVSAPFFVYLLSRLEKSFNDLTPTLLVIDEGWRALKNRIFSAYFEEWIKTLRKKNVDVVFSITNLQDVTGTQICETIMSNVETKILFKDANALNSVETSNYRAIGLSDHLIEILPTLPDFCPLTVQGSAASIVDFGMRSQIEYLTTPPSVKKGIMND